MKSVVDCDFLLKGAESSLLTTKGSKDLIKQVWKLFGWS